MAGTIASPDSPGGNSDSAPLDEALVGNGILTQLSPRESNWLDAAGSYHYDPWKLVQRLSETTKKAEEQLSQAQQYSKAVKDQSQQLIEMLLKVGRLSQHNKSQAERLEEEAKALERLSQRNKSQADELEEAAKALYEEQQVFKRMKAQWASEKALNERLAGQRTEELQQVKKELEVYKARVDK